MYGPGWKAAVEATLSTLPRLAIRSGMNSRVSATTVFMFSCIMARAGSRGASLNSPKVP